MNLKASISPHYRDPLLVGACFQAGFLFLGAGTLDFGQLLKLTWFAILIYWLIAALIISRRPQMPTKWDLILLRSGFVIIWPIVVCLEIFASSWRGLH